MRGPPYIPQSIDLSCKNEAGEDQLSLNPALCEESEDIEFNINYYFKNTTEPNEYFACAISSTGEFKGYRVGLKKCDDGPFIDKQADCAAPRTTGIQFKDVSPVADQYTISVSGDQVHIRSMGPAGGIDCQYDQGICSYSLNTNASTVLEVVNVKTDIGLTMHDYEITWSGHPDCADRLVVAYGDKHCEVSASKRQYVKDREEAGVNQLTFLNFSGHGISRGGAEDLVLGFILKNSGAAYTQLHAAGLGYTPLTNGSTIAPKADFYQVLYDEIAGNFYSKLLHDSPSSNLTIAFSPSKITLREGIYTMLLYPSNTVPQNQKRGMVGISLKSTALTLSDLSVRGHLQELVGLNFIVGGTGTQKMKISSTILEGHAETQLILSNLSTGQILFHGVGLTSGTVDIGAGAYAATLNTLSGEGIGMIEIDFIQ